MRKITELATKAFYNGDRFSLSNTLVSPNNSGDNFLYLHGHLIASVYNGQLEISSCGWKTTTTKERLNGILKRLNMYIKQKNFQWYLVNNNNQEKIEFTRGNELNGVVIF